MVTFEVGGEFVWADSTFRVLALEPRHGTTMVRVINTRGTGLDWTYDIRHLQDAFNMGRLSLVEPDFPDEAYAQLAERCGETW